MKQHCDPEVLDQAALGTLELSEDDLRHVTECTECDQTLRALRHVAATARDTAELELVKPPDSVWQGVLANLQDVPGTETSGSTDGSTTVFALTGRSRNRWTRWVPLAAAAVVGVIVGGVLTGALNPGREPAAPSQQVVATADLTPLPDKPVDPQAAGSAAVKSSNGKDILVVNTAGLPQPNGFYEVWLMDPKTAGLISIGSVPYGDQQTTLALPAGVQLDKFSVVDISDEPMDGNPEHSSVSVLRGQLSV